MGSIGQVQATKGVTIWISGGSGPTMSMPETAISSAIWNPDVGYRLLQQDEAGKPGVAAGAALAFARMASAMPSWSKTLAR